MNRIHLNTFGGGLELDLLFLFIGRQIGPITGVALVGELIKGSLRYGSDRTDSRGWPGEGEGTLWK